MKNITTTTVFDITNITRELVAYNPRATYSVADYKRMIWEAHKDKNAYLGLMTGRMILIAGVGSALARDRCQFAYNGRVDGRFGTAMWQYVTYIMSLMDVAAGVEQAGNARRASKSA